MKDSRNLIMQVKCLNNVLPTLSELRKRKPELYKSNYCILCEKNCSEDLDHIMSCSALQKLWKEVEEAVAKGIRNIQDEKNLPFQQKEIEEILFSQRKEDRYKRRKELVIDLEKKEIVESLQSLTTKKEELKEWMDSAHFIMQRSFIEIIWSYRCEKINKQEKGRGITTKEKRSNLTRKKQVVKIPTDKERKKLLSKRKKERKKKKV